MTCIYTWYIFCLYNNMVVFYAENSLISYIIYLLQLWYTHIIVYAYYIPMYTFSLIGTGCFCYQTFLYYVVFGHFRFHTDKNLVFLAIWQFGD